MSRQFARLLSTFDRGQLDYKTIGKHTRNSKAILMGDTVLFKRGQIVQITGLRQTNPNVYSPYLHNGAMGHNVSKTYFYVIDPANAWYGEWISNSMLVRW